MLTLILIFKYFRETKNVLIKIVKLFQSTSYELRAAQFRDDNFGECITTTTWQLYVLSTRLPPGRRHGAAAAGEPRARAGLRVYSRHWARAGGGASCSTASGRGPAMQVQGIP